MNDEKMGLGWAKGNTIENRVLLIRCGEALENSISAMLDLGAPSNSCELVEAESMLSHLNALFGLKEGIFFSNLTRCTCDTGTGCAIHDTEAYDDPELCGEALEMEIFHLLSCYKFETLGEQKDFCRRAARIFPQRNLAKYALRAVVEQLKSCKYVCEAGPLEHNSAFVALCELAM